MRQIRNFQEFTAFYQALGYPRLTTLTDFDVLKFDDSPLAISLMPALSSGLLAILTPTGNTGRHVVETALAQGQTFRVLVRDATRLAATVRERCEVVQDDMLNPADLTQLLDGAGGAFFCVPQSPNPTDIPAYYRTFTEPFAKAAQKAGVQRIVSIAGGDDSSEGFDAIGQALLALRRTLTGTGIATRHLLCGYFMDGFFYQLHPIAQVGYFSLPVGGDVPIPFVAA